MQAIRLLLLTSVAVVLTGPATFGQVDKEQPKQSSFKPLLVRSQLAANDPLDKVIRTSYCKTFTHVMPPGNTYVITMTSNRFLPYLRVEDDKGKILAVGNRAGGQLQTQIVLTPRKEQGEKFRIVAASQSGRSIGPFTLTVTTRGKEREVLNVKGKLDASDPFDWMRTSCHHKAFTVKMEAGKTYTIDLMGNFDPYLRLEDALGNHRAQDDDGGVGLNARLQYSPIKTDNYRIIVTSCGGGRVGNFQLIVKEN